MGRDIGVGDPVKKDYIHACPAYVSVLCKKMLEKRINACAKARRRRDFVCVCGGGFRFLMRHMTAKKNFGGRNSSSYDFFQAQKCQSVCVRSSKDTVTVFIISKHLRVCVSRHQIRGFLIAKGVEEGVIKGVRRRASSGNTNGGLI